MYIANTSIAELPIYTDIELYDNSKDLFFFLGKNLEVLPGHTLVFDEAINLESGDFIRLKASALNSLEVVASIDEEI